MKVASLFAGCGGLDLGLIKAGHEIVFSHDIDKDCVKTYKENIGNHIIQGDIYELKGSKIPDADLLTGGFPCQGFSIANIYREEKDKRNELYVELVRIIREKKPTFFLAENVPGIMNLAGGKIARIIEKEFSEIGTDEGYPGYEITRHTLNAVDYGVPQFRKRVIWVGISRKVRFDKRQLFFSNFPPDPTHSNDSNDDLIDYRTMKDAIYDLPIEYNGDIPNHDGTKHKVKINNYIGNRALDWDRPSPTIVGRGGGTGGPVISVHPSQQRRFSVRETARLQSFPDDFIFHGSISSQYRQIGNAVAVHFAYHLGKVFKDFEDGKLKEKFGSQISIGYN